MAYMVWEKDYTSSQEPMRNGINLNGWQRINIKVIFAVENFPQFHVRFHWNERFALFRCFYMRCKLYFRYHIRLMFTLNMILCIAVTRPASLHSLTPFESNTPQSPTSLVAMCFLSQLVTLIRQRNVARLGYSRLQAF